MTFSSLGDATPPRMVWRHFLILQHALTSFYDHVIASPASYRQFSTMALFEIENEFQQARETLEHQTTLSIIAAFEAVLQLDFLARMNRKRRDPTSKRVRKSFAPRKKHIKVDNILDVWREITGRSEPFGLFKQLYLYRHWLAHGKYWTQKSGINPRPEDALNLGEQLVSSIPDLQGYTA